jgi:protein TonB
MELKKNPEADLGRRSSVLRSLGIMAALSLTLVAFQWRWYGESSEDQLTRTDENLEDEEAPISMMDTPPPPPPPEEKPPEQIILEIIEDESEEEESDVSFEEATEDTEIQDMEVFEEEEPEEEEIFSYAEEMPSFPGGAQAMYEYMAKNTKYPTLAKESGIQGKVFVGFVVGRDGAITNVRVLRGIGGGCDEEAIRVVKKMPKWNPGKQRGKPVKVEYRIPYDFRLQ